MRVLLRVLAAVVLVSFVSSGSAVACTGEQPTFDVAIAEARAIAVVEVVADAKPGQVDGVRLVEVISGDPTPFLAQVQRTGLCGDTIESWHGRGARVLVAYGVTFYGSVIHPSWSEGPDGALIGSASIPGVGSLEALATVVRQRIAPPGSAPEVDPVVWLLFGAVTVGAGSGLLLLLARRLGQ